MVGRSARMLGVRVGGVHADMSPDSAGCVHPLRGGMSVTVDDPSLMPVFRRPRWLDNGASEDPLFSMAAASVVKPLLARQDAEAHAFVEPDGVMDLSAYEAALAATRLFWKEECQP